jgi:TRAP-type C4-dicarboxylate transport system permease small subunit
MMITKICLNIAFAAFCAGAVVSAVRGYQNDVSADSPTIIILLLSVLGIVVCCGVYEVLRFIERFEKSK